MIVDDVKLSVSSATAELSARVRPERRRADPFRLWYRFPAELASGEDPDGSAFVAATLPLCMRSRERLVVDAPVSRRLMEGMPELQELYARQSRERNRLWTVRLDPIDLRAQGRSGWAHSHRAALMFTRGVDSFYALLTLEDPSYAPTHLAYCPTLDRHLSPDNRERSVELERQVAEMVGRTFVRVDSNPRSLTDPIIRWSELHPTGLASVALALAGGFGEVVVATLFSHYGVRRWGGERMPDLWSTERLRIFDHGPEVPKLDKIRYIAESQIAMRFLKVCLTGDTPLNCGTCEKCLRTMGGLFVSGALDLCATFEQPLRFERLASSRLGNPGAREFVEQLVLSMGDSPDERRLKQCLEASLGERSPARRARGWVSESISQLDKVYLRGALRRSYRWLRPAARVRAGANRRVS